MMRGVAPCCCNVQGMEVEVVDDVGGMFGQVPVLVHAPPHPQQRLKRQKMLGA